MKIRFSTQSAFIRTAFPKARVALCGVKPRLKAVKPVSVSQSQVVESGSLLKPGQVIQPAQEIKRALPQPTNRKVFSFKKVSAKVLGMILTVLAGAALAVAVVMLTPSLYYKVFPAEIRNIQANQETSPLGGDFNQGTGENQGSPASPTPAPYVPPRDETLPEGDWLVIPRIGVRTQPQQTEDVEAALEKGVWMVPGYGNPGDRTQPMILAAHRFGWKWWWQSDYWKYHSFYLLPELEPGDTVEVIADKRKWVYEVYAGQEGDEITDYNADLILYTCKFLNSPIRHIRYARLIDPTKDTQQTVNRATPTTPEEFSPTEGIENALPG